MTKSRRMIVKAKRESPNAKIVFMGCFPKVYRDEAEKLGVDLAWGVGDLDKLISKITTVIARSEERTAWQPQNRHASFPAGGFARDDKSRYFLKIQDGCEQFCSYCIIPHTRGKLKSREEKEIIKEFKEALEAGYREIVLCGIHLGLYGGESKSFSDKASADKKTKGENNLADLLKKLVKVKGLGRTRLSSIEVNEVSDDLMKLIKEEPKICNHLHIPLQSGCDKILKAMNRPYNKKIFKNKIQKIRKIIPDIAISTDVIVGFPGEIEEDFQETYDFIKELEFSKLHVFPFSPHDKTPASRMKSQIERKVALVRASKLRKLGIELEKKFKNKFAGKEAEVLVEGVRNNKIIGKSSEYFEISARAKAKVGDIIKIKL